MNYWSCQSLDPDESEQEQQAETAEGESDGEKPKAEESTGDGVENSNEDITPGENPDM